jgi:signal transduction histidine kinase
VKKDRLYGPAHFPDIRDIGVHESRIQGTQSIQQVKAMATIHISLETYILAAAFALIIFLAIQMFMRMKSELRSRELSRHLIQVQEEERKCVARELHDDFGQRLALVKLDLEDVLQEELSMVGGSTQVRLHGIVCGIDKLSSDIQHLSHTLHSGRLQYLGLKPALKEICGAVERQYHIAIELQMDGLGNAVPKELELCLYRVAQEALHNIAKHSGAGRAAVKVMEDAGSLRMAISDDGRGFSQAETSQQLGLGLASMRERLSIVGGRFQIESTPGRGTLLSAQVPLTAIRESSRVHRLIRRQA